MKIKRTEKRDEAGDIRVWVKGDLAIAVGKLAHALSLSKEEVVRQHLSFKPGSAFIFENAKLGIEVEIDKPIHLIDDADFDELEKVVNAAQAELGTTPAKSEQVEKEEKEEKQQEEETVTDEGKAEEPGSDDITDILSNIDEIDLSER